MELFSPFKDIQEKKRAFVYIIISIILFLLFDYGYEFNIFGIKGIEYYNSHTIYAFLYEISNIPMLIITFWALAKFSRGIVEWFRYVASLIIDFCTIFTLFAFRDPTEQSWSINYFVIFAIVLFIIKLILFKKWKRFKDLKVY